MISSETEKNHMFDQWLDDNYGIVADDIQSEDEFCNFWCEFERDIEA